MKNIRIICLLFLQLFLHSQFPCLKRCCGDEWHEVSGPNKLQILKMIADHTFSNYDRIGNWSGTYTVEQQNPYTTKAASQVDTKGECNVLLLRMTFTLVFVVDIRADAIYRSKSTGEYSFICAKTQKEIEVNESMSPVDERTIVKPNYFYRFDPKIVWPGFVPISDHPHAQNKRAAFRQEHDSALMQTKGDLMDPRHHFGFGSPTTFAQELQVLIDAASDGRNADSFQRDVLVYQSNSPEGKTAFRVSNRMSSPSVVYATSIYREKDGFNPESFVISLDPAGTEVLTRTNWKWQSQNGIMIPTEVGELANEKPGSGRQILRKSVLSAGSSLNSNIGADQFSPSALGLAEGELIIDKVESVVYLMRDGVPEKLARFGEFSVDPLALSRDSTNGMGLAFTLLLGVFLIVIYSLVLIQKKREA